MSDKSDLESDTGGVSSKGNVAKIIKISVFALVGIIVAIGAGYVIYQKCIVKSWNGGKGVDVDDVNRDAPNPDQQDEVVDEYDSGPDSDDDEPRRNDAPKNIPEIVIDPNQPQNPAAANGQAQAPAAIPAQAQKPGAAIGQAPAAGAIRGQAQGP
eukprot:480455_1